MADTYDEVINDKLHGKGAMADMLIDAEKLDVEQVAKALENISKMGLSFNA